MDYKIEIGKIQHDESLLADLMYDTAFLIWSFEFNREPPLHGHYLNFASWEELDSFMVTVDRTIPWNQMFEKTVSLYTEIYGKHKITQSYSEAAKTAIKLLNAYDKVGINPNEAEKIMIEALTLAEEAQDYESAGSLLLSRAHYAAYRAYDARLAFECTRKAQSYFMKLDDPSSLYRSYSIELVLLDPERNQGEDKDYNRVQFLASEIEKILLKSQSFTELVQFYIEEHKLHELHKGDKNSARPLFKMIDLIKSHSPDDLANNLLGIRNIFTEKGLKEELVELSDWEKNNGK